MCHLGSLRSRDSAHDAGKRISITRRSAVAPDSYTVFMASSPTQGPGEAAAERLARLRIEQLREQIRHHAHLYYDLDKPEIPDAQYDRLVLELRDLESRHPRLGRPDSPTLRVGGQASPLYPSVRHVPPMLSLATAFTWDELTDWYRRTQKALQTGEALDVYCEPKIDGVAVALHYSQGKLRQGATRGDGHRGEDVTANLKRVKDIPLDLSGQVAFPNRLEVRGEVYLPVADFLTLNEARREAHQPAFANPRNAAAGSLRQREPQRAAPRPLAFWAYQWVASDGPMPATQAEALSRLAALGFPVQPGGIRLRSLATMREAWQSFSAQRAWMAYEIDGLVFKLNDLRASERLGHTAREPRGAMALKFSPARAITKLLDIRLQVGRSGGLFPSAVLQPVSLGGVTVQSATLHNEAHIRERDIRIGDFVELERAGDVIPRIVRPLPAKRNGTETIFTFPRQCPSCAAPLRCSTSDVVPFCTNPNCSAKRVRQLMHFVSRAAMDIEGLGEIQCSYLVNSGLVSDPGDLYRLRASDLRGLPRAGTTRVQKWLQEIEKSRQQPLAPLVVALGVPHVGRENARTLAETYPSLAALADARLADLVQLRGIGPKSAAALIEFFASPYGQKLVQKLVHAGVGPTEIPHRAEPLRGQTYVLTGRLSTMTRTQARQALGRLGAHTRERVSPGTTAVIVGESPGQKIVAAESLGVPRLDEAALLRLLENAAAPPL